MSASVDMKTLTCSCYFPANYCACRAVDGATRTLNPVPFTSHCKPRSLWQVDGAENRSVIVTLAATTQAETDY